MSSKLSRRVPAATLALALACVSLVGLCSWLTNWLFGHPLVERLQQNSGTMPAGMTSMAHHAVLGLLALAALLAAGLLAIMRLAWQTWQQTQPWLRLPQAERPPLLLTLLSELGLTTRVTLAQTPVPLAFCYGFLRPRIFLSTGLLALLTPAQLEATLLHEECHRRHFDPLRLLVIDSLVATFFFLPVVQAWGARAHLKLELAADGYASRRAGRPALAGALHRLLTFPRLPLPAPAMAAAPSANAARVAALLGEPVVWPPIPATDLLHSAATLTGLLCLMLML